MDYATFVRQVERGEAPPIALLHGGDGQLLDDALDAATRGLFPDRASAAWGREVFDGRERGVDEIVRSAMTLPLGAGRRLIASAPFALRLWPRKGRMRSPRTPRARTRRAVSCCWPTSRCAPLASAGPTTGCSAVCRPPRSSSCRRGDPASSRDGFASARRSTG